MESLPTIPIVIRSFVCPAWYEGLRGLHAAFQASVDGSWPGIVPDRQDICRAIDAISNLKVRKTRAGSNMSPVELAGLALEDSACSELTFGFASDLVALKSA